MQPYDPPRLTPGGRAAGTQGETSVRDVWHSIRRSRWLVLGVMGGVVVLAAIITLLMPRIYESESVLRIRSDEQSGGLLEQMVPVDLGLAGLEQDEIDTEIGVIRSRQVAHAVVDSLGLRVVLDRPSEPRHRVLRVLEAGRGNSEGEYVLRRRSGGGYSVTAASSDRRSAGPLPERVALGEAFQVHDVTVALEPALQRDPPDQIRFSVRPFQQTVNDFRETLKVDRQEGRSRLVEINYRGTDPWLAADVVNAVATTFIAYKLRTTSTEARSTVDVLREQVAQYERQLEAAEATLQRFQEQQQMLAPQAEAEEQIRRLAEIQVQHDAVQVERTALANLLEQVDQGTASGSGSSPYRRLAGFPTFIANPAVQDLLQSLLALESRRTELLVRRTEQNVDVAAIDERIDQLERQLYDLASNYLDSLERQTASTSAFLRTVGQQLTEIPAREIRFAQLKREQQLLSQIYILLQTELKEAEIQQAIDAGDVRIIDEGIVPQEPVQPKPLVNMVLASVLGLMLGLAAALGRDMLDTRVRSKSDAELAAGGVPVIGAIPSRSKRKLQLLPSMNGNGGPPHRLPRLGLIGDRPRALLISGSDRHDPAIEAYRDLRTSLTRGGTGEPPQVLVITSAAQDDGKSTSAANLAITLAQQGTRTLLVDADLRRGRLARMFEIEHTPGLTEVLRGQSLLGDAVHPVDVGETGVPLEVLPAGSFPPYASELLGSDRMLELLAELRQRYEAVILDAPPLQVVTDAALLAISADATLLIARAGATERAELRDAAMRLRQLGVRPGGIVLNDSGPPPREYRAPPV